MVHRHIPDHLEHRMKWVLKAERTKIWYLEVYTKIVDSIYC
jgi:hypothetical protein